MSDPKLNQKIADVLRDMREEELSPYDQVLQKLRDLAAAVEASLAPDKVQVRIQPGHSVSLGQQYRFVLLANSIKYRDVLFLAYVPMDGFPVTLDLFDKHSKCETLQELEDEVVNFLRHPEVKQRLLSLKDVAA